MDSKIAIKSLEQTINNKDIHLMLSSANIIKLTKTITKLSDENDELQKKIFNLEEMLRLNLVKQGELEIENKKLKDESLQESPQESSQELSTIQKINELQHLETLLHAYEEQERKLLQQHALELYQDQIKNKPILKYTHEGKIINIKILSTKSPNVINIDSGELLQPIKFRIIVPMHLPLTICTANDLLYYLIQKYNIISYMKTYPLRIAIWNACTHLTDFGLILSSRYTKWTNVDKNYISFLNDTSYSMLDLPQHELMLTFKFLFAINGHVEDAYKQWLGPQNFQYFDLIDTLSLDSINQNIVDYMVGG